MACVLKTNFMYFVPHSLFSFWRESRVGPAASFWLKCSRIPDIFYCIEASALELIFDTLLSVHIDKGSVSVDDTNLSAVLCVSASVNLDIHPASKNLVSGFPSAWE